MLTHLTIKNFKGFQTQDIPLEQIIVLVGRNNSGKTTALQALTLWNFALRRWLAERETSKSQAKQRIGVPVTREQLVPVPTRILKHLWYNTKVYAAPNKPALIEILVKGRSTASRT
ncbi:MAG TPA: AAA family ATPase, partial [Thioploca sp.]|nr:AAA family ATPase [Thioploca sp.]